METPKEKAVSLAKKFYLPLVDEGNHRTSDFERTFECAKIAVDELIESIEKIEIDNFIGFPYSDYWQEVKNELEKM